MVEPEDLRAELIARLALGAGAGPHLQRATPRRPARLADPRLGAGTVRERLLALLQVLLVGVHAEVQERVPERGGLRREHVAAAQSVRSVDMIAAGGCAAMASAAHVAAPISSSNGTTSLTKPISSARRADMRSLVPSSATRMASPKGIVASASIGSYTAGIP